MTDRCPCTTTPPTDEYLLVKATGKQAPTECTPESSSTQCLKSDKTYDQVLSDFALPAVGQSVTILVCNGSLYSVGEWIYFFNFNTWLKIVSIDSNRLTVRNGYDDSTAVSDNPTAGMIISNGSYFIVCDKPYSLRQSDFANAVLAIIKSTQEIEIDAVTDANLNEKVVPLGEVTDDSTNPGFKKVIRKILSFFFVGNDPYWKNMHTITDSEVASYRNLMVHKTSGLVGQRKGVIELIGSPVASKKYLQAFQDGVLLNLSEVNFFHPCGRVVIEGDDADDIYSSTSKYTPWTAGSTYSKTLSLNIPEVTGAPILEDYFYAWLQITVAIRTLGLVWGGGKVLVNGELVSHVVCTTFDSCVLNVIAKIDKSAKTAKVDIGPAQGLPTNIYMHAVLRGLFI